jgi:hypothetical protein
MVVQGEKIKFMGDVYMQTELVYKGVLCRLATYRTMGENRPALYYIDAPDQQTMLDAGFDELHYGLWAKLLTDAEYKEITDELNRSMKLNEQADR